MNKTTTINLSGQLFTIDDAAYIDLKKYLDRLKSSLKSDEDAEEIIADFEQAVAEHLLELLPKKDSVVTLAMVTKIIQKIGDYEPSDAPDEKPATAAPENAKNNWQSFFKHPLYLDKKGALIGGVCSGIARSLEVDSFWIRLLFVALAVATQGLAVLVYIVLMLIMKEPQTLSEELAASGDSPTAATLVAHSKRRFAEAQERLSRAKTRERLQPAAKAFKTIMSFIGVIVSVAAITIIVTVYTLLLIAWLTHRHVSAQPFYDVPPLYIYSFLMASFFLLLLPVILLLMVSLSGRIARHGLNTKTLLLLLAPWLIMLVVAVTSGVQMVPKLADWSRQHPNNPYFQMQLQSGHVNNFCLNLAGGCNYHPDPCEFPPPDVKGCM